LVFPDEKSLEAKVNFQSRNTNSPPRRRDNRGNAERRDEKSNSIFLLLFSVFSLLSLRLGGELVFLTVFAWDRETTDDEEL